MRGLIALALLPLAACGPDPHVALARQTIADHCAACHTVPGVALAKGTVGPDLAHVGQQQVLGGTLPNTRENLIRWITRAQSVSPGTAMPDIPLTARQAQAVADYLYSLD